VRTYAGHQGPVAHVAPGPDAEFALSSSIDGTIRIWRIDRTGDELRSFVLTNRYLPELDCATRAEYQIKPLCK
jgi:WD40 repeat protein